MTGSRRAAGYAALFFASIANAVIALIAAIITAFVIPWIRSKGFKIDAETLDKLIEAAVFNLPDYFVVNGIPAKQIDGNKE